MCREATPEKDQVLCSRCGKVANPTDGWEHDWPLHGYIKIGFPSCIEMKLLRDVVPAGLIWTGDHPTVKMLIHGQHPVIKSFGFQGIELAWSHREGRLCYDCQAELLAVLGKFFFGTGESVIRNSPNSEFGKIGTHSSGSTGAGTPR